MTITRPRPPTVTTSVSTTRDVIKLGTILGIWAHPDDETYLSAGVMAAAMPLRFAGRSRRSLPTRS